MAENKEYQFGQGWREYLSSEYSLSPAEANEPLKDQDSTENAEYKFGSGYENVMKSYEDTSPSSEDVGAIQNYAEKITPSIVTGATAAAAPAALSAAYQSGKYAIGKSPMASTAIRMAGPAIDVFRGKPPADLMQRAAQIVSNPAFERGILGSTEDVAGTTGRARQTMYNTETARQAAVRRGVNNPFTQSTWGATNAGVLVPPVSQPPKPAGGLSSMISPQMSQAATEVKNFASAVAPKVVSKAAGGFGLGFSGAETLRTGFEMMREPAAIPQFVLNAIGTLGGLGMFVPGAAPIAAPFAIGAPALASVIGMAREGSKREAQKNLPAKERFLELPETTPGERGLPINERPAMSRSELGYRDARKGALYLAEP